ncbi:hypothetical protein [Dokdonia sp.]|uniref:hypothetical protein n=1 Tax=Dokdonia sp. TaxID=2024995 RepID=UPI003263EA89
MQPKHENSKFKKWLDLLQQESWQLELIISGVAIFGLVQAIEPIVKVMNSIRAKSEGEFFLGFISGIGFTAILISLLSLTICLIIHVILRGLWIGAVGLRYFSGDIDYEVLNYTDKFKTYLKKRIGSFDKYIANLEDYCSLIFALSFLLVFFFISFFFSIGFAATVFILLENIFGLGVQSVLGPILVILFAIAYLMTAFDFFTQGFLKKKKWLAIIYFPIYRLMSRITFSFLYRPLLYNLLDNKLGKRILAVMVPVFVLGLLLFTLTIKESNYHIDRWDDTVEYAKTRNYYDQMDDKENTYVSNAAIPSNIIKTTSLPVFIKHKSAIENVICKLDSTLTPIKDVRGLEMSGFRIQLSNGRDSMAYPNFKKYMSLLSDVITIKLDSLEMPAMYIAVENNKGQRGYETVLDLQGISRGHHVLHLARQGIRGDSLVVRDMSKIPFWYYPD